MCFFWSNRFMWLDLEGKDVAMDEVSDCDSIHYRWAHKNSKRSVLLSEQNLAKQQIRPPLPIHFIKYDTRYTHISLSPPSNTTLPNHEESIARSLTSSNN